MSKSNTAVCVVVLKRLLAHSAHRVGAGPAA